MHPILFEIPGIEFPIRSFGVMVVAGFLLGTWAFNRLVERHTDNPAEQAAGYASIPIWTLIGVLVGARAFYVVVEILRGGTVGQSYLDDPFKVFAYWEGGLVMYGGAAGGVIGGLLCSARHRIALWNALDLGLMSAFLGLTLGRIGCLMVGDDFGQIVPESVRSLPFPITVRVPEVLPEESLFGDANAGQILYATQIWMSANALLLYGFGLVALRLRRYPGQATLWMLLWYAIARGTIEAFRGDEVRGLWFDDSISTSQVISIAVGIICLALLAKNRGKRSPVPGRDKPGG